MMFGLWVVSAAITIWCRGAEGLPTLTEVSPLANWNPESGVNPDEIGDFEEGDMDVPVDYARNGLVDEKFRWPNGTVAYVISGEFNEKQLVKIHTAFEIFENSTNGCISFVERTDEHDRINIKSERSGCHSAVGKTGGSQTVNLDTHGCFSSIGLPLHELLHALGFHHEQSRFDRNEHVTINWENIKEGHNESWKASGQGKS
ncbi:unnamed protein product, partial [Meganyctiphanes norvegica]